jgi:hypothetical protein
MRGLKLIEVKPIHFVGSYFKLNSGKVFYKSRKKTQLIF